MSSKQISDETKRSMLWYLLPVFLQVIGGLIVYFLLRQDSPTMARRTLLVGIILSAATISVLVLLYFDFQADMAVAYNRIANGGSHIISTNHGTLEYAKVGNGYPILFVHGAGGGYDQGLILSKGFLNANYHIIAPSRFGFLHTPLPTTTSEGSSSNPTSFAAQADAYSDLLDQLHIKKVAVVAFSAGGPSSIEFALRHPDKISVLVLASAVIHQEPQLGFMDKVIHNGFFKSDFAFWLSSKYFQTQFASFLGVSPGVQSKLSPQDKIWLSDTLIPSMYPISMRQPGMLNDRINFVTINYPLEKIRVPTLLIHAKDDTLVNPSHSLYAAQKITNAKHIEFESGGHVLLGHEQDVKFAVSDFFAENHITESTNAVQ